jgi:hypothetical protein
VPEVLRDGRYRFFFWSNEGIEPPHVHVEAAEDEAKFWLDPVGLARNRGFRRHELTELERKVREHRTELLDAWHRHFGRQS